MTTATTNTMPFHRSGCSYRFEDVRAEDECQQQYDQRPVNEYLPPTHLQAHWPSFASLPTAASSNLVTHRFENATKPRACVSSEQHGAVALWGCAYLCSPSFSWSWPPRGRPCPCCGRGHRLRSGRLCPCCGRVRRLRSGPLATFEAGVLEPPHPGTATRAATTNTALAN